MGIFHSLIIATFLLGFHGCGYKANPFYMQEEAMNDEHVDFIVRKLNVDNNKSATCVKEK